MIIHKCDKCGNLAEQERGVQALTPKGWRPIIFSIYSNPIRYEVCEVCAESLGIAKAGAERETIGENLVELITEISQAANQE
jgi:hypothetical protein